jgi:glycosyltransferase involved in cell wall biosynthesis
MKPRLLFISGTFLAVSGGAEISALALLQLLQQDWHVFILTCNFCRALQHYSHEGMNVASVPYEDLHAHADRLIRSLSPQLIYTVMLGSDLAMQLGQEHSIPTVVNICKVPVGPRYLKAHPPTKVLAVSKYVQDYLRQTHAIDSTVLNPIVQFASPPLPPQPEYITMFNPVGPKGGTMFRALAAALPEHRFAWVPGWDVLRGPSGSFDPAVCEAISRTIDIPFRGGLPAQVLMDLPNITRLEPVAPPHPIFQKARILLVPSQWDEAFGRVAVEAMFFKVPVLGSRVGGLADIVEQGGMALPKDDLSAWVAEIKRLDAPDHYQNLQARGEAWLHRWHKRTPLDVLCVFRGIS